MPMASSLVSRFDPRKVCVCGVVGFAFSFYRLMRFNLRVGTARKIQNAYISRRPSSDLSMVTSSAYSSSEPTGTPIAMRVTFRPRGLSSLER
jgi:hypothetical protein